MNYQLPKKVKNILENFKKNNFQIYIVGGAVRDLVMKRKVNDWDFTTDAKPEEILKLFPQGFYDNKFGTVGISVDEDEVFEITTMRKEGLYKDHRHPDEVSWSNKIAEDLARRDFTINALALGIPSASSGNILRASEVSREVALKTMILVDPFQGQADIQNKLIRTVGDPNLRFQEDALRLIRAVRIATELEFDIEIKTFQAIKENADLIKQVAWERIRDEFFKLLISVNPYIGISQLRKAGILQIILSELERCFGIMQQGPKHDRIYDIGEHSLLTLKYTPSHNPLVKFAALLHDIGKADTHKTDPYGNVTFYNHEVVGGNLSLQIAKRFNLSKKETDKLYKLIRFHMFTVTEDQTDSAIRRFIKNVGKENIQDIMALRIGDRLGGGTEKEVSWRMEKFQERINQVLQKPFSLSDLKINGEDIMKGLNIKPGPQVGEILQKLFEEVLEDNSKNNRDYLIERIKILAN